MAYGIIFNVLLICCLYHVQVWSIVLHALIYMHRSDYLSLSGSLQRIRRCSSALMELDFFMEWLMVWFLMSYLFAVYIIFKFDCSCYMYCVYIWVTICCCRAAYEGFSTVYHVLLLLIVLHALMCMHTSDYLPLSDSLQRVRRWRSTNQGARLR